MIRTPERADLERILAIEAECHPNPWTTFEAELVNPFFLVIGRPVEAYVVAWLVAGELQIQNITTAREHRRKGHARALLEHVLPMASVATLEVRDHNAAAIALYTALGFQRVGLRKRYYSNGDAALLMTRG